MRRTVLASLIVLLLLALTLAVPLTRWRTGEPSRVPLPTVPGRRLGPEPLRIWIDTDAACGTGPRTDPDDCLALLRLARADGIEVVGISTVFGNAPIEVTDSVTRVLVAQLPPENRPPVARGAGQPGERTTRAAAALREALRERPLVVVAVGPLTNLAAVLEADPAAAGRVQHAVAVMGRRRGHLFHPVEGGTAPSFLGHGPVFRDFNFAKDPAAAAVVIRSGVPLSLVPYDAGRDLLVGETALDRMARRGGAERWVAARARRWLDYWQNEIGLAGFYPFDLAAAEYVIAPARFGCIDTRVAIGRDAGIAGFFGREGLFAGIPGDPLPGSDEIVGRARYCPAANPGTGRLRPARPRSRSR